MELDREFLASESLTETVDLKRLHRELVEAIAYPAHAVKTNIGWLVTNDRKEFFQLIRSSSYEDLAGGKWKRLIGMPDLPESIVEHLESVINAQGDRCSIGEKKDLECLREVHKIVAPEDSFELFLQCLSETATNQALDRIGIRSSEHRRLESVLDIQIAEEGKEISRLVFEKLHKLLTS